MNTITGGGVLTSKNISDLNANFTSLLGGVNPGTIIYCQPSSSNLGTQDGSQSKPYTDLVTAFSKAQGGKNDVIVLVGNGAANGSARLTANLDWNKDAVHLVGVSSGVNVSNRSRIAPASGVTAFANFFTVSGSGCRFENVQLFQGFATGTTAQICLTVSGDRNAFVGCHVAGMGDQESADDAGSRSVKITGEENLFSGCTIGLDTITRGAANASVEFASGTARNQFLNCTFPFMCDAASPLGILGTGAACMDRYQTFVNCDFINATGSTSTTMTVLTSLTNAAPGGILLFRQCVLVAIGEYGDTLGLTMSYIDGLTGAAATSGIAVKPS
jgi:hypothetical protein